MTATDIIERQALKELLQLIRVLNEKETEETHEHNHIDYRGHAGQPEAAR